MRAFITALESTYIRETLWTSFKIDSKDFNTSTGISSQKFRESNTRCIIPFDGSDDIYRNGSIVRSLYMSSNEQLICLREQREQDQLTVSAAIGGPISVKSRRASVLVLESLSSWSKITGLISPRRGPWLGRGRVSLVISLEQKRQS